MVGTEEYHILDPGETVSNKTKSMPSWILHYSGENWPKKKKVKKYVIPGNKSHDKKVKQCKEVGESNFK